MTSPETEPTINRRGTIGEDWHHIDGATVSVIRTFDEPTNSIGAFLELNLTQLGEHDVNLQAIYGKKDKREEQSSGDSLCLYTFDTSSGLFILTDIEDGFTALNEQLWRDVIIKSNHWIPRHPDTFFHQLNHNFTRSEHLKAWLQQTVSILSQLDPSIAAHIRLPNHESPIVEIALKEILRSYLTIKNEFRKKELGGLFFETEPGKELANGVFGVSGLLIPKEASRIPDLSGTSTSGTTIGGFAVCRSLADIAISTSFPSLKVHLTDTNSFFDFFIQKVRAIVTPEQLVQIRAMIYDKVDQIYAAFNDTSIVFPLTEEESTSALLDAVTNITIAGATDGAYHTTRTHDEGNPTSLFLTALSTMIADPAAALATMRKPADDYLMYNIAIQ